MAQSLLPFSPKTPAIISSSHLPSLFPFATKLRFLSISTSSLALQWKLRTHHHRHPSSSLRRRRRRRGFVSATADSAPFFPGSGFQDSTDDPANWDSSKYEALLKGGEQVTSVLQDMLKLLEDMDMDAESEPLAVEIAAQGVIGKRVDEMEAGFMMALDYMIQMADKDDDRQVPC